MAMHAMKLRCLTDLCAVQFFAMVNFCNPGVLGSPAVFRKYYESPILASREPGASPEVLKKGEERSEELSGIVNDFILRRTNKLLSEFQPPKVSSLLRVCDFFLC